MRAYFLNLAIAFSLLAMALCGGKRNETLSGAAWSMECEDKLLGLILRPVIDWLAWHLFRDIDHCSFAWIHENRPAMADTQYTPTHESLS